MAQLTVADVATHGFLVDGKWMETGDVVEVTAPYDGAVIGRVYQGRREHAGGCDQPHAVEPRITRRPPR